MAPLHPRRTRFIQAMVTSAGRPWPTDEPHPPLTGELTSASERKPLACSVRVANSRPQNCSLGHTTVPTRHSRRIIFLVSFQYGSSYEFYFFREFLFCEFCLKEGELVLIRVVICSSLFVLLLCVFFVLCILIQFSCFYNCSCFCLFYYCRNFGRCCFAFCCFCSY